MTGAYPFLISPGWLRTMTLALKFLHSLAGSFLESEATFPRRISFTETFLTLKPTLSPGRASGRDSWCISTDLTSVVTLAGAKFTTIPGLITPVSTRPTGLSVGREGGTMESRASMRVKPLASPFSLVVLAQPFSFLPSPYPPVHQAIFSDFSNMLSPCHPEMGQKITSLGL